MKLTTLPSHLQHTIDGNPILIDIHPKTGEVLPWIRKKLETMKMAEAFRRIEKIEPGFKYRAAKLEECGNYLEFKRFIETGERQLSLANFCKYRLCPMCSWRRSLKIYGQASQVMDEAEKQKYRFIFVTLTMKNCKGVDLGRDITRLYSGSLSLLRRAKYKKTVHGWMRVLEVTHNTDYFCKSFDTYHPHIHMIWAVKSTYFRGDNYISQAQLAEDFQKAMKLDYAPRVDIRAVKVKDKGAIREVAKYAVKPSDILVQDRALTDSAILTLDKALAGRRLVSWGGVLKNIKADLNLDDAENGDLVNTDGEQPLNEELAYIIEKFSWGVGLGQYMQIG